MEVDVHRKSEVKTEGDVATSDIRVVCWCGVPGIGGNVTSFGEDLVGVATSTFDGDDLVEETVEAFDAEAFVVATGEGNPANFESCAHLLEDVFELAVIVDDDYASDANTEKDVFKEFAAEVSGVVCLQGGDDNGGAQVVHGGENAGVTGEGNCITWNPNVEVDERPG